MKRYALLVVMIVLLFYVYISNVNEQSIPTDPPIPKIDRVKRCMEDSDCYHLTEAAYYEARGEPITGILAVMNVVKNRVEHEGKRFPNTIKAVLAQRCEFSYKCDGSMNKKKDMKSWEKISVMAYDFKQGNYGYQKDILFYHSNKLVRKPVYTKKFPVNGTIGQHTFYSCYNKYC